MDSIQTFLIKAGIAAIAVLAPVHSIMLAAGFLIITDFATGIYASIKRGQKITSFKMRRTVVKMLAYQAAIVVGFVMETYLVEGLPVVKVVGAFIGLTEGKSFFENIQAITGFDIWSALINRVQGKPLDLTDGKEDNK